MTGRGSAQNARPVMLGVTVLALTQFVIIVDETAVSIIGPVMARDLHLGAEARHVLITPFAVAFVCALPLTGALLRRADPRAAVIPAAIAFALTAGAGAAAQNLPQLVGARAAQGAAAAVSATCLLASVHLVTSGHPLRVRAFAVFSLVSGAGAVSALVLIAPLASASWRWCFVAVAVGAVGCAGAWAAVSRRLRQLSPDRPDAPGPTLSGDVPPRPDHLTAWTFAAVIGANAVLALTVISVSFELQQDHGWSPTQMGWGFLVLNGAAALGALTVARVGVASSVRLPLIVGMFVLAGSCVLLATVASTPITLLLITIPVGLGIGVVFPVANHGTLDTAGARPVGRAATLGAAQQAGLAAGAIVAATRSNIVVLGVAVVVAVGVLTALLLTATTART